MNDDDLELAGAVADGLATDEERQRVEADADLQRSRRRCVRCRRQSATCRHPPSDAGRPRPDRGALRRSTPRPDGRVAAAVQAPTNMVSLATRRRLRWISAARHRRGRRRAGDRWRGHRRRGNEGADNAADRAHGGHVDITAAANVATARAGTATTIAARHHRWRRWRLRRRPWRRTGAGETMEVAAPRRLADDAAAEPQALRRGGGALPDAHDDERAAAPRQRR